MIAAARTAISNAAQPHWQLTQEVFEDALDLPPHARASFVEQYCGDRSELKREVLSLLESVEDAEVEFEVSPIAAMNEASRQPESHGDQLPGYELLHEIHRGGQGVVYKAKQLGTKRDVAIKYMFSRHAGPSHQQTPIPT